MTEVVIVGGGPAGIRAAATLVDAGLRPILVDEGGQVGGQGYRAPSPGLTLDMGAVMGTEAGKYRRIHALFKQIRGRIDYRPRTLAWAVEDGTLYLHSEQGPTVQAFAALILATGATDRIMPVRGWTLPGVFTLGGAQVALKDQACLIGRRVVFLGSSPLLHLAALQYRKFGAEVTAIADTTPLREKLSAIGDLFASPRTLARGLAYRTRLRLARIRMLDGATPLAIEGGEHVEGVRLRDAAGREHWFACDAVALGYGLKPEAQLAELAGCTFRYDEVFRQWFAETDADGRARPGLYLAGDGAVIGGADAAEASGALAAYALLADFGRTPVSPQRRRLRTRVERLRRFQRGLARAFAWPVEQALQVADDMLVCRCEAVTAGEIRSAIRMALGSVEVNRVKAITRCGMGRCQGRFCGPALQEITAAARGVSPREVGRLRTQAPVKPIPLPVGEDAQA